MLISFIVLVLTLSSVTSVDQQWTGELASEDSTKSVKIDEASSTSVFRIVVSCTSSSSSVYLSVTLRDPQNNKDLLACNTECNGSSKRKLSLPYMLEASPLLDLRGIPGTSYNISLSQSTLELDFTKNITLTNDEMVIGSFSISDDDIETQHWGYVQIMATSPDKFLDPKSESETRNIAKLFITKNFLSLSDFYERKKYNHADEGSLQSLSFSTFGGVTLSNSSHPPLSTGTWYLGLVQTPQEGYGMSDKVVRVSKVVVKEYSYDYRIVLLLMVSMLGFIFPLISRIVFDWNNFKDIGKTRFRVWLRVMFDWVWRGDKGYPYLMTLLMMVLSVGAFQVVNAKWLDMVHYGDRDLCYYNEKCYRPYGYYDISVNDCASNLPFIVHGVLLLLYFSLCEAYCRSVGHVHFDYSIPYAFGVTLICEGFGSFLYHICPSQLIFQFDTMFMFMISILQIVGIFEGYSIRKNDIIYEQDHELAPKSLQPSKVICCFVGPVYFFNFMGNLTATQGLPIQLNILFYTLYASWLLCLLCWAGYNLGVLQWVLPCLPAPHRPTPATPEDGMVLEQIFTPSSLDKISKRTKFVFKSVLFVIYVVLTISGAVLAFFNKLSFSIYLLGILTIAVLALTCITFIPLMHRLILWVRQNHNGEMSCGSLRFWGTNQIVIAGIMLGYVLVGCGFSAVSLVFFSYYEATDKSVDPWLSRELNDECFADDFYSAHDVWHLLASFSLVLMILVNVQIGKPCRDCYLSYLTADQKENIRRITVRWRHGENPIKGTIQRIKNNVHLGSKSSSLGTKETSSAVSYS